MSRAYLFSNFLNNKTKREFPNPQMPLSNSPKTNIMGTCGIPLNGNTIKKATSVGARPPKKTLFTQKILPVSLRTNCQIKMPQSPPKKAREITLGTPNGGTGFKLYGAMGIMPIR